MGRAVAGWDDRTELAAATVDVLGHIDYLLRSAPHFRGTAKPPQPVPRPVLDGNSERPGV